MREVSFTNFLILKKKITNSDLEVLIISGSMEPFIGTNEKILVSKIENLDKIKKYTPIVFHQKDKLVCHMFIKWIKKNEQTLFISKGINSNKYDKPTKVESILGEVKKPKMSSLKRIFLRIFFK